MTRTFDCSAIVFDLDGVLADSTQAVNRSWEAWSKRRGIDPQRAIETGHGRTTFESVQELAPDEDPQQSSAEMEELEESFVESVIPVCGVPEFVESVNALGIPWAVATSSTQRIAIPRLQRCGVPIPNVLITADRVARGKPDPEPYRKAAAGLGVEPWTCVVFEDARSGMLAARRAGALVVGIAAEDLRYADAAARDFFDLRVEMTAGGFALTVLPSRWRCACCGCHTLAKRNETCPLCLWQQNGSSTLADARSNVDRFGIAYAPSDKRFAVVRHPILGPAGEYAVDRVALRSRALQEFGRFGKDAGERAHIPERLEALLGCIRSADSLYNKQA